MAKNKYDLLSPELIPVIAMRMRHGWMGYGIYCALIHLLTLQPEATAVADFAMLAFHLHADEETVRSVVEDFGLFSVETIDGAVCFYIPRLREEALHRARVSARRAEAASKRWHPSENKPTEPHCTAVSRYVEPERQPEGAPSRKEQTPPASAGNQTPSPKAPGRPRYIGYQLLKDPDMIRDDEAWMRQAAADRKCSVEIMRKLFDIFFQYIERTSDGGYEQLRDAKAHFLNWLAKPYARSQKERYLREEANATARRERDRRDAQAVSYNDYLRRASEDPAFASTPLGKIRNAG